MKRAAFLALLCVPVLALAQPVTSTRDRMTTPGPQPTDELIRSDRIFRTTIACVVERQATRTRLLLDYAPGSKDESRLKSTFQSRLDHCNSSLRSFSFAWTLFRGAIAETHYHREFPNGFDVAAKPAEAALAAWTDPRLDEGGVEQLELLHSAARCLVASEPARVRDLLTTTPLGPEEGGIIAALQKPLGTCVFSGMTFTSNRQSIRGLLAEAAFKYAIAQRDGFKADTAGSSSAAGKN